MYFFVVILLVVSTDGITDYKGTMSKHPVILYISLSEQITSCLLSYFFMVANCLIVTSPASFKTWSSSKLLVQNQVNLVL